MIGAEFRHDWRASIEKDFLCDAEAESIQIVRFVECASFLF